MSDIVLYLHVHQPFRIRNYTIFDAGYNHDYFESAPGARENNQDVLNKVSEKSYLPTNQLLAHLLETRPEFKFSLSMSGVVLEQLEKYRPDVLKTFQQLVASGRVEIVGETYYHSLAFFYEPEEFENQVIMHRNIVNRLFGVEPTAFRNTELAYNNQLAKWCDDLGYKAVIAEGWDPILSWRSPNYVYQAPECQTTKLLVKNYRLSDDIAFRFGNQEWSEWPLTADKFTHWIHGSQDGGEIVNLFMDYETFGEHQWQDSGIFEFLKFLPESWAKKEGSGFKTISEAADAYQAKDVLDMPHTVTWADSERDLSAWIGNSMQTEALRAVYELTHPVMDSGYLDIIEDWRKLQTSDHFYYMCTKWWNDGDVHAYFSPYESPYDAQMNFMNAILDLKSRLSERGAL